MRSRSRDVRSTRREVQAMKRGEAYSPLAPDSRLHRDNCRCFECDDTDTPFPLPNGTQADPRQAWVLPSNEQEK